MVGQAFPVIRNENHFGIFRVTGLDQGLQQHTDRGIDLFDMPVVGPQVVASVFFLPVAESRLKPQAKVVELLRLGEREVEV